ncbi:non-contractile tail tubular protein [Enterobacter phage 03_vB_Eclo_IJM]|nr:non-contractile tail tubular protein [Enterobacter phage 03_vB_Eclo_IJM]
MPSFVDSTINDVFFYRNRLGFLSGENVIMSRSAGYFAFFLKSVATLSDDDPIDVAVSHPRISILKMPYRSASSCSSGPTRFSS